MDDVADGSKKDFVIEDQKLVEIHDATRLRCVEDLWSLLGDIHLPRPFHTGHLAEQLGVCRSTAQRIAYVMRQTAAIEQVGKQGNSLLYTRLKKRRAKAVKHKKEAKINAGYFCKPDHRKKPIRIARDHLHRSPTHDHKQTFRACEFCSKCVAYEGFSREIR